MWASIKGAAAAAGAGHPDAEPDTRGGGVQCRLSGGMCGPGAGAGHLGSLPAGTGPLLSACVRCTSSLLALILLTQQNSCHASHLPLLADMRDLTCPSRVAPERFSLFLAAGLQRVHQGHNGVQCMRKRAWTVGLRVRLSDCPSRFSALGSLSRHSSLLLDRAFHFSLAAFLSSVQDRQGTPISHGAYH